MKLNKSSYLNTLNKVSESTPCLTVPSLISLRKLPEGKADFLKLPNPCTAKHPPGTSED